MDKSAAKSFIENGKACMGLELGSTRVKAVLINDSGEILAKGTSDWENRFENGVWTYSLDDAWLKVRECYASLKADVASQYGVVLKKLRTAGISGMMHGYLPFGRDGKQLAAFRTWRNTMTSEASAKLTEQFKYNIPQRWSIAHLYQAILNREKHVSEIDYLTTLAGYIHWKLTEKRVIGIGEASGMFPIDTKTRNFNGKMLDTFDSLSGCRWKIRDILPEVIPAGKNAGYITSDGALLLDPSGDLEAGIPMCPPEGDAQTGMVATDSVSVRTANVSAGTSAFAMAVLEKDLSKVYPELDLVTTPDGALVAMAHAGNCASDLDAWIALFEENLALFGVKPDKSELYEKLFTIALEGKADCGSLVSYCFFSGEHVINLSSGAPMFIHGVNSEFNLANFMRAQISTSFAVLKIGMDIITKQERIPIDVIKAHGGIFKTKGVAQKFLAAALGRPVVVMENAGEGGPWGMALLASYANHTDLSLSDYLDSVVFKGFKSSEIVPDKADIDGFERFMERFLKALPAERAAADALK